MAAMAAEAAVRVPLRVALRAAATVMVMAASMAEARGKSSILLEW